MYCHHCEKKRADDAIYCSQCGRQLSADGPAFAASDALLPVELSETAASAEPEIIGVPSSRPRKKRGKRGSVWAWLTPGVLAIVMSASVFTYYRYEMGINDRVLQLQNEAKEAALAGNYDEALMKLKEAAQARPAYAAIGKDMDVIAHAAELENLLNEAVKALEEHSQSLSESEHALEQIKDELKGHTEPIYKKARESLKAINNKFGVMKLTDELVGLETVDELAAKLSIASHLNSEEAAAVRADIVERIVNICLEEGEALLKKKNYSEALAVIDKALSFANGDDRLIALEKKIQGSQTQYEKTEQQRLEQAMQKAAAEDLKNQTAAVEVVKIESKLDELGDLQIEAELRNVATRAIYAIKVQYTVFDKTGNKVGFGEATATPEYVEPGEKMSFKATVKGVQVENPRVVVDPTTWYLD